MQYEQTWLKNRTANDVCLVDLRQTVLTLKDTMAYGNLEIRLFQWSMTPDMNIVFKKCSKPSSSFLNSSLSCNALSSAAYVNQYTLVVWLFSIFSSRASNFRRLWYIYQIIIDNSFTTFSQLYNLDDHISSPWCQFLCCLMPCYIFKVLWWYSLSPVPLSNSGWAKLWGSSKQVLESQSLVPK